MQTWRRLTTGCAVVLVVGIGSCGNSSSASQRTTGPYAVGTRSLTFVDETRETPAFGDAAAQPTRTVVTDVWYPAAGDPATPSTPDAVAAKGPFPVIVFNHGQQGDPQQYTLAFEMWTRAGYVVAAPRLGEGNAADGPQWRLLVQRNRSRTSRRWRRRCGRRCASCGWRG